MIALIEEEEKAPSPYPNCNKALLPLRSTDIQHSVEAHVVGWFQCQNPSWNYMILRNLGYAVFIIHGLKHPALVCAITYHPHFCFFFFFLFLLLTCPFLEFWACLVSSSPHLDSFNLRMIYIPIDNSLCILYALRPPNTKQQGKHPLYLF